MPGAVSAFGAAASDSIRNAGDGGRSSSIR